MGTLRIKRGTKTALQTSPGYVPAEGELVYTTDSKEVFVGDGATTGGTPVSVSTQNLEDLGNVQALAAQNDQILVYNGSNWAATDNPAIDIRGNIYGDDSTLLVDAINGRIVGPVVTSSVTATNVVGNLTGDVVGSITGNVVGNTTGTHFGNVVGSIDGDVTGSVFGDDSVQLLDGLEGEVVGPVRTSIVTIQDAGTSRLVLDYNLAGATSNTVLGEIRWQNNKANKAFIQGRQDSVYLTSADDGTTGITIKPTFSVYGGQKIKIEPANADFAEPTEALEVLGNIKGTGFVQFGSLTTTQRNALTAANGMVIYNSSDNKFQGYENGGWVNLI